MYNVVILWLKGGIKLLLTRDCKTVLNFLNEKNSDTKAYGKLKFTDDLPDKFDRGKFINTLDYLQNYGYLTFDKKYSHETFYIFLNHKAIHYKEISVQQLKGFIFKSLLIPIVVSTITSLLTIYIRSKF